MFSFAFHLRSEYKSLLGVVGILIHRHNQGLNRDPNPTAPIPRPETQDKGYNA